MYYSFHSCTRPHADPSLGGLQKKEASSGSESEASAESSGDETSDSSSDEGEKTPATKKAVPAAAAKAAAAPAPAKKADADSDSDSSSDSSDDEDAEMKDAEEKPAAVNGGQNPAVRLRSITDQSTFDALLLPAKRKAENGTAAPAKKAKLDESNGSASASAKIYVGALSWNVDDEWLKSEFDSFGTIVSASVATDRETGKSRGFGFVEFTDAAAAQSACSRDGSEIDGRTIKVNVSEAKPARDKPQGQTPQRANGAYKAVNEGSEPTKTLFVGSLPWAITEDQLWEKFGEFGPVSSIRLPTDRETGKVKGFGYVEYVSVDAAKKAMEDGAGLEFDGRPVNLDVSLHHHLWIAQPLLRRLSITVFSSS